jgi:antitoxin (DNA-binding transcriptional repressor) of toxin-antitoxin stability system
MNKVNILEIKTKLSEYLDRAQNGETIVICRHNRPVAELRALSAARVEPRPIGPLPNRPTFDLPDSFFEPLPGDELDLWEGAGDAKTSRAPSSPRSRATRVAESPASYGRSARTKARRPRS